MKALCVKDPWLSAIMDGEKGIETRTWSTKYRGRLLLCMSKKYDWSGPTDENRYVSFRRWAGHGICVVDLVDVRPMTKADEPAALCACEPGRFAWILANPKACEPMKVRGQLGLFPVTWVVKW